ncbi:hypothetical protein [Streptomyces sp. NPDC101237]|uniref:hypothetical protein n=1 Tax=Streptomyces sp. NPDC101237 TaxID=3366139 RepID=UPI00380B2A22
MAQEDSRRVGRPMKPIGTELPDTVITWLQVWRGVVLEPLRAAAPAWTLDRMSAELARRTGTARSEGGARGDASGISKPALQRFFAGERVPARDVVQHLLDIACEDLKPPPDREQISGLWNAYRAALRTAYPLLADLYDALDQRDAARSRAEELQAAKDRLTEDLALSQRQEQRQQVLLRHAATELEQARQTAILRDGEARRAEAEAADLALRVDELTAQHRQSQQDQQRLEVEIRLLREQAAADGALTQRITQLQAALEAAQTENEELAQMVLTAVRALRDAHDREDAYRSMSREALQRRDQLALPGPRSAADLEHRHEIAVQAVEHLSGLLRTVSRELAEARAELIRRDGDLARLVEEHAHEIAALRADRILAEADGVLSLALQNLHQAPAALPATDVPAQETTRPSSSTGPAAPPRPGLTADASPPHNAAWQDHHDQHTVDAMAQPTTRGDSAARPRRDDVSLPPAGIRARSPKKEAVLITTALGAVLVTVFTISWALDWPGDHTAHPKTSPSAPASRTPSPSTTPLPGKPANDPVADIGAQEVNTAKVMALRPCKSSDLQPSLKSVHNAYDSGEKVRIELTARAADQGKLPCRIDAARSRMAVAITAAASDNATWDSSACTAGHSGHRWIEVTRSAPASVDFTWNRVPNHSSCSGSSAAGTGTYLAETLLLGHTAQTSFVLSPSPAEDDQPPPTPSVRATRSTGTSTGTATTSNGSTGDGLLGGADGSQTQRSDPTPSDSVPVTGEANGANGSGANGSGNGGGFFGGPAA